MPYARPSTQAAPGCTSRLTPSLNAGRAQDIRPQLRRHQLPRRHHPRRIRIRAPLPPQAHRRRRHHARPHAVLPGALRLRQLLRRQPAAAVATLARLHLAAHCPHRRRRRRGRLRPRRADRKLRPRAEPRPRAARRPDPGPRAAAHAAHLHAHVGPGCSQAVCLRAGVGGGQRRRGARHAASQRLLFPGALARPGRWAREPGGGGG